MDVRTLADLIISVILLGALGAGSRGLWVYGKAHEQAVGTLKEAHANEIANLKAAHAAALVVCEREAANLREVHARELAARDREIADRDRRLEVASVTEARLIEMALRTTVTGERAASAAEVALRGKAS